MLNSRKRISPDFGQIYSTPRVNSRLVGLRDMVSRIFYLFRPELRDRIISVPISIRMCLRRQIRSLFATAPPTLQNFLDS